MVIVNGPNLNLLGERQPDIYGNSSFEQYQQKALAPLHSNIFYFQSNQEGDIVNVLQFYRKGIKGILLNAGGYTHTSVAIADALASVQVPVIEVHISNPAAREPFRHTSLLAKYVRGSIAGFGLKSYQYGLKALLDS